MPALEFMHAVLEWTQKKVYERSLQANATVGPWVPKFTDLMRHINHKAAAHQVGLCDDFKGHVMTPEGRRHVVNAQAGVCTCGSWQDQLFPCSHGVAVINATNDVVPEYKQRGVETFVSSVYSSDRLANAYSQRLPIVAIDNITGDGETLPPESRNRGGGRPRKRRFQSTGDWNGRGTRPPPQDTATTRPTKRQQQRCSQCQSPGHNRLTCSGQAPTQSWSTAETEGLTQEV
jgi:zinc finger SWIM domain-containing protein 3